MGDGLIWFWLLDWGLKIWYLRNEVINNRGWTMEKYDSQANKFLKK